MGERSPAGPRVLRTLLSLGWLARTRVRADFEALADLPRIEALLQRMLALDEGWEAGNLHRVLGILATLRPPALGGDPEAGRAHFERALALSGGRNLAFKVDFARHYARMIYDRELHDRLLTEVLAADPEAPGLTLFNVLAQREAQQLLAGADGYF